MATAYQYQELSKEGYIRVLTLYPATELDAPICGHLKEASLSKSSNYCALSYSWGMNKDGCADLNRSINLSGKSLAITQNLFEGLRRIRDQVVSKRLWIDAVCIDQSNIPERNAQVAQMANIYSCTSRLVVWLGEGESEEEDREILTLATLLEEWNKFRRERHEAQNKTHVPFCGKPPFMQVNGTNVNVCTTFELLRAMAFHDKHRDKDVDSATAQISENPRWLANVDSLIAIAIRIYTRRYWRRRWGVQELYHSGERGIEIR